MVLRLPFEQTYFLPSFGWSVGLNVLALCVTVKALHNSNTFYFFLSILNPLSLRKSFMSMQRTPFLFETAGILLFFVLLSLAIKVQLWTLQYPIKCGSAYSFPSACLRAFKNPVLYSAFIIGIASLKLAASVSTTKCFFHFLTHFFKKSSFNS